MSNDFKVFLTWVSITGHDTAYTYDTERSKYLALSPMTNDLWMAWQAALASQQKPAPVLLTDDEIEAAFFSWVKTDGWLVGCRAIESAVLRKNGWGG